MPPVTIKLPVVEIIGPTVQGEGPRAGRRAALIRLGGCNLTCQACDTRYAWDGIPNSAEHIRMSHFTIMELLDSLPGWNVIRHVVITGGEPLMHQERAAFKELIRRILAKNISVEIETNGTIIPGAWFTPRMDEAASKNASVAFSVSPKIVGPLATDPEGKRFRPATIQWFNRRACATFKIVCQTVDDVIAAGLWADQNGISRNRVWIMPEGATWDTHLMTAQNLVNHVMVEGMNLSTRLHLALWPAETRGH